jgi:hypothetical protein
MIYSSNFGTFTIGTSAANSDAVGMGGFAGGVIRIPASNGNTTLTFFHSDSDTGTFQQMYDTAGAAISATISSTLAADVPLPSTLTDCHWVKVVGNSAQFEAEFLGKVQ